MIELDSLFGAGGGDAKQPVSNLGYWYFPTSGSFVAPIDMTVTIHGVGAGGRGGLATGVGNVATGAGAGGYGKKRVKMLAGQTLTVTVGASAVPVNGAAASNGVDGGDTIFLLDGVEIMRCGGGKGGKIGPRTAALLGGDGGTVTGGDVNNKGGRGGNIGIYTGTTGGGGPQVASGGGGVDLFGLGRCKGGDVPAYTIPSNPTYLAHVSSGGGPLGEGQSSIDIGQPGTATHQVLSLSLQRFVNAQHDGVSQTGALSTRVLGVGNGIFGFVSWETIGPINSYTAPPGPLAGGWGSAMNQGSVVTISGAGEFAGAGGCAIATGQTGTPSSGAWQAGLGGGGGGHSNNQSPTNTRAGQGGNGWACVEFNLR